MGAEQALLQVRADLCDRIDALASGIGRLRQAQLCGAVDSIRRTAQQYDLAAVAMLARAMEAALANGERGALIRSQLELMREAVGCERLGAQATEAFLAAASVRLADASLLRRH